MTNEEIIEQLENAIDLIKQDGKDWLDDRDIPILEECIKSLTALDKIRTEIDIPKKYGEWIPVSEKLPNLDDYSGSRVWQRKVLIKGYLSFDDKKELFISDAFAKDVVYNSIPYTVIVAWTPLPKL